MSNSTTGALRGLRPAQPATESAATSRLAVLYLAAAARDRLTVRDRLVRCGAAVSLAGNLSEAVRMLAARRYGLIVVDLAGEVSAIAAIRLLRAQMPGTPVVGVMDPADPSAAAEAIGAGAVDLLPFPFEDRDVQSILATARDRDAVELIDAGPAGHDKLFAHSPAMRLVADAVTAVSSRKVGMLLVGEPATGRTVIARTRHELDDEYVNRPFVTVECGIAAAGDLERRLFGTCETAAAASGSAEPAAKTGAVIAAQGGTLFLKDVGNAPARVQARLARVLRDREVFSTDVNEIIPMDVRVIAGVGPDIDGAVADGRVRRDLFERLAHHRIEVPPFHRRREDLPFLAASLLRRVCEAERSAPKSFSRAALSVLLALPWRDNGREMTALVTAIVRSTRQPVIQVEDVLEQTSLDGAAERGGDASTLRDARARFEREYISRALIRHHGRVGDAARSLGIQRTNLYRKVRQLKVPKTLLSAQH